MKTKVFILSTISLLSFFNIAFASDNEICVREFENKNYTRALQYCEKACSQDSGEGCNKLGWIYMNGYGVKQDYKQAKNYYEKACDLKNGSSCTNLGNLYTKGNGVEKDDILMIKYYIRGCRFGNKSACQAINNAHIGKDALNCLENDDADACFGAAATLLNYAEFKLADLFYKRACELGRKDACIFYKNAGEAAKEQAKEIMRNNR